MRSKPIYDCTKLWPSEVALLRANIFLGNLSVLFNLRCQLDDEKKLSGVFDITTKTRSSDINFCANVKPHDPQLP